MDFIQEVESKINLLREKDPEFKIFGSWEHKYEFNNKVTESEVRNFEEKFNQAIPSIRFPVVLPPLF